MKNIILSMALIVGSFQLVSAQNSTKEDSLKVIELNEILVEDQAQRDLGRLPDLQGTYIFSGKKSEVVTLEEMNATVALKTPRQVFAKIPGVFVYDMDGSGNQVNISTRGLDAHRGWEFNIRKDGALTNSDMYGYPASHFSMPFESIERIELVRGTGSLQYGGQFGGMLNYITKKPDSTKAISMETSNTIGSFGLLSTFNSVGGRVGRVEYYAYASRRVNDGYRENGHTDYEAQSIGLRYFPTRNLTARVEWARSKYVYQLPGQLNDSMYHVNPRMSTRGRNYYSPDIHVPSVTVDWDISKRSKLRVLSSAVLGQRSSVMFDNPSTVVDSIDLSTGTYANRKVDIDNYHSYTTELRFLQDYNLGNIANALVVGGQYMNNNLHRRQNGKGTTGSDFDYSLVEQGWGRDLRYKTSNIAFFAENKAQLTSALSWNLGLRLESGRTELSGETNYYPGEELPNAVNHKFPLFGSSFNYRLSNNMGFYGGWSQSYRPVVLKDIVPGAVYEISDDNLKDATGSNAEIGFRGSHKLLKWDASLFSIVYNNRMGNLAQQAVDGSFQILRTNIGNSVTRGIELFAEASVVNSKDLKVSVFTSTSFMDATYQDAVIRAGTDNVDISGNQVESVPPWISRNGLNLAWKSIRLSMLYSYVAENYADPQNTVTPDANGAVGLVPSYQLVDINATIHLNEKVSLKANLNNVLNETYYTKRPLFYPGPGIWTSDGRNYAVTLQVKL
jgi:Fe(3+) dicitrate transport protein